MAEGRATQEQLPDAQERLMNVINMPDKVRFITDLVFPITALPQRRFPMFTLRCGKPVGAFIGRRTGQAYPPLDHAPES